MDGEEIRSLLASVAAPADMPIPVSPNMSAIPAAPVLDAGADPAAALTARGVAFDRFEGVEQDDLGVWRSPGRRAGRLVQGPGRQHALADAVLSRDYPSPR